MSDRGAKVVYRFLTTAVILLGMTFDLRAEGERAKREAARGARMQVESRTAVEYRSLGSEEDTDVYEQLYYRHNDLGDRRLDLYLSGRYHADLDDVGTSYAEDPFVSEQDLEFNDEVHLYQGYFDLHDVDKLYNLRAGRQYITPAQSLHLDGAELAIFERRALGGSLFGGQPVSYYTSVSGDFAAGGSLVTRPWQGGQARVTLTQYHDDSVDEDDMRTAVDVRQNVDEELRLDGQCWLMDSDFEMAGLDLYYLPTVGGLDGVIGGRRWGSFDATTRAYTPLTRVLGTQDEYTYVYGRVSQPIGNTFAVSPGAAMKQVDEANAQNRNYGHYDLTFTYEPSRAWSASVAGEYWDVEEGDRFAGVTGDLRYRYERIWELTAGSGYQTYEYVQLTDLSYSINGGQMVLSSDGTRMEITPDSYTYYLRGRWNLSEMTSLRVRAEVEDNSEQEDLSLLGRLAMVVRL